MIYKGINNFLWDILNVAKKDSQVRVYLSSQVILVQMMNLIPLVEVIQIIRKYKAAKE